MNVRIIFQLLAAASFTALSLNAQADYMSAYAEGSATPVIQPSGPIINGLDPSDPHYDTRTSFLIREWGPNPGPVGEGVDDETLWSFNFNLISYNAFYLNGLASGKFKIAEADLWLTLWPKDSLVNTDCFELDGLGAIGGCSFAAYNSNTFDLPVGGMESVHLNLTDFYSANELRNLLVDQHGIVTAQYADDVIISEAKLQFHVVPAPSGLALLGVGLLGLCASRRKI